MTALEIIGIISIVLATFVALVVLPLMAKFIKKAQRALRGKSFSIPGQVGASLESVSEAQDQIDALVAATEGVKSGVDAAIAFADRAVAFLDSAAFQVGFPAVLWTLFLLVALPRGLRRRRKKVTKRRPIPPPSWERLEE